MHKKTKSISNIDEAPSPEKQVCHSTSTAVRLLAVESEHGADGGQQVRVSAGLQHLQERPEHAGREGVEEPVPDSHAIVGPEWRWGWPGYGQWGQTWTITCMRLGDAAMEMSA